VARLGWKRGLFVAVTKILIKTRKLLIIFEKNFENLIYRQNFGLLAGQSWRKCGQGARFWWILAADSAILPMDVIIKLRKAV